MKLDPEEQMDNLEKRLIKIEMTIWGLDEANGLRSKVREHQTFIDQLKPQLQDLMRYAKSIDDIKDTLKKIFIAVVITAIITVGSKFIQIQNGADTLNEVKAIKEEEKVK
jgi:lipid II:glycine glycyltransferase (peptidoglycan interpeptide bridge formation enzyme)